MIKKLLILVAASLFLPFASAQEQSICPLMVETEIDEEEVVEFEGKQISCVVAAASKHGTSTQNTTLK